MVIPQWLKSYMSEADLRAIESEIRSIEKKTCAEIVPVIVRSSSNYNQASVTITMFGLFSFAFLWEVFATNLYWDSLIKAASLFVFGLGIVFFLLPRLANLLWMKRLLTVRSEELEQCWKRAKIEFYENCVNETQDKVGVLIFISILEKSVIILADKTIAQKLPQDVWQKAVDAMLEGFRQKNMGLAFKNGLAQCSNLLAENFPVKLDDVDELANNVVIKE